MNVHETRTSILAALKRCGSHKLPDSALKETIRQISSEDISEAEIQIEINYLEAKGWIDFTTGPLGDPEKRWFITSEGKKKLN